MKFTAWLIITPFYTYDIHFINLSKQMEEELALCIEEQFGVKELSQ